MGNTAAYSQFLLQQYGAGGGRVAGSARRPPLPDYHAATQMAHLARRNKHQLPQAQPLIAPPRHELLPNYYSVNGVTQNEGEDEEEEEEYDDDNDIITQGRLSVGK